MNKAIKPFWFRVLQAEPGNWFVANVIERSIAYEYPRFSERIDTGPPAARVFVVPIGPRGPQPGEAS
jgi:hypothetical protein